MFQRACPYCGRLHLTTEAVTFAHQTPVAGDLSICSGCGGIGRYVGVADLLEVEKASDEFLSGCDEETKARLFVEQRRIRVQLLALTYFGMVADGD